MRPRKVKSLHPQQGWTNQEKGALHQLVLEDGGIRGSGSAHHWADKADILNSKFRRGNKVQFTAKALQQKWNRDKESLKQMPKKDYLNRHPRIPITTTNVTNNVTIQGNNNNVSTLISNTLITNQEESARKLDATTTAGVEQVEGPPSLLLQVPPPAPSDAAAAPAPPARQGFAFVVVVVSKALYALRLELELRLRAALEAVRCAPPPPLLWCLQLRLLGG
jgi:hypothetical protein